MLTLYKNIPPKIIIKGIFISKIVLFGTFQEIKSMLLIQIVMNC